MQFKQTYKQENMKKSIYCYVNGKRVSHEKFTELEYKCRRENLNYNSSYLFTKDNGRIESGFCYS